VSVYSQFSTDAGTSNTPAISETVVIGTSLVHGDGGLARV
jgi:hypothetical protein